MDIGVGIRMKSKKQKGATEGRTLACFWRSDSTLDCITSMRLDASALASCSVALFFSSPIVVSAI